ncbi:AzlC family ABC transporter permease [Falsirhodobacter sp. alg1]|uniref:AzlC family ABC transporter permease n=1 Tax=Falsirhodobacter sp. alg1 TaxID=1472418 RepID=UPI0005EF5586|nr:AzlC family ABC transporter permease [Falsirhodobacter sp. alg1]
MTSTRKALWQGFIAVSPFLLVVAPFAILFGVVATEAGLDLVQIMGFSLFVVAGAAQFVALQLAGENAPLAIILLTSLAVNLRLVMYSAAIAPYLQGTTLWQRLLIAYSLTDQSFAVTVADAERHPRTLSNRLAFYTGSAVPLLMIWYGFTLVGAVAGSAIPPSFALDFALPISFIALLAPSLRSLPHVAACSASVAVSLMLTFMPYGTGVLVAAVIAMIVGSQTEVWLKRRARA